MICRIWHGYTTPQNADGYDDLLRHEVITGIEGRSIEGFREIQVLRRDAGEEVEFVTLMWFDSLESVERFGGDDYQAAVVPPAARQLLTRFDERSQHYEVRDQRAQ